MELLTLSRSQSVLTDFLTVLVKNLNTLAKTPDIFWLRVSTNLVWALTGPYRPRQSPLGIGQESQHVQKVLKVSKFKNTRSQSSLKFETVQNLMLNKNKRYSTETPMLIKRIRHFFCLIQADWSKKFQFCWQTKHGTQWNRGR